SGMLDGDVLVCLNYRADRTRQILAAIAAPGFYEFDTGIRPK
ncbi:MAG TPA: hypothetical protein DCF96_14115, partial [Rhodobacteraceae bacterium]|nr:hypothetical protein [Paracoccaceae bacterium]